MLLLSDLQDIIFFTLRVPFLWYTAKNRQGKKPPKGWPLPNGVLFSLMSWQREKGTKKETNWPAHGLARNFLTKLPWEFKHERCIKL